MGKVYIGTSGWIYDGWRGPFYPKDVAKKRWLAWYATQFATAEIKNRERLAAFLPMLPEQYRYAFEFRDASWYDDAIFDLLRRHKIALCISDHHDAPAPREVTARHVYVRGHGPTGEYRDNYPAKTLRRWARAIAQWSRERRTIYVYFDNDWKSAAPADARRLREIIKG